MSSFLKLPQDGPCTDRIHLGALFTGPIEDLKDVGAVRAAILADRVTPVDVKIRGKNPADRLIALGILPEHEKLGVGRDLVLPKVT